MDYITTTMTTKTTYNGDNLSPKEEDDFQSHRPKVEMLSKLSKLSLKIKSCRKKRKADDTDLINGV